MKTFATCAPLLTVLLLAACSTTGEVGKDSPAASQASSAAVTQSSGKPTSSVGTSQANTNVATAGSGPDAAAEQQRRLRYSVFFDFDSNAIPQQERTVVDNHGEFLAKTSGAKVVIAGSADERGSREYNLALGQRRADAVKKALGVLGVPESRMESVSYGEEKPFAQGSGEAAWAQNRRADILYPH